MACTGALPAVEALRHVVPQLADLIRSAPHAGAPALGTWTFADVAAHVTHAFELLPALVAGTRTSPLATFDDLGGMTTSLVADDPERDLARLAARLEQALPPFLAGVSADPHALRPWIVDGYRLPAHAFAAHLLCETLVHGYDLARACHRPWRVPDAAAAAVLLDFIVPVVRMLAPGTFVDPARRAVRARFELRLHGGGRVVLHFDAGRLTVEPAPAGPVDCRLWGRPPAMLLVGFGRLSQQRAILRGQLAAWGRRPWLGPAFPRLLRTP